MGNRKNKKVFSGKDLAILEANVEAFKKELGTRYISERMLSNNPEYQIEVEFWAEDKK